MLGVLIIIGKVIFVVVLLLGLLASVLGLPGTVLILLASFVYSACTHFQVIPWWMLAILLGLTVIAESGDNVLSAMAARKYGSSTRGMFAAVAGGLGGAVAGGVFVPALGLIGIPLGPVVAALLSLLAPIAGAFAGGFGAAYAYELRAGKPSDEALRAGWGAFFGRALGICLKLALSGVMIALVLWQAFFSSA